MTEPNPSRSFEPGSWDARYAGDDYLFGTDANQFLVSCGHLLADRSRVLCIADGEGRNGVWLAEQGHEVDTFDPSAVAVGKARRLAAERGVSVGSAVADADSWDWPDGCYDAVAAIFVQFASPDLRRRIFARTFTALRPGGLLLLEGYSLDQLAYGTGGPRSPEHLYTEEQLRAELGAFEIDLLRAYHADVQEGPAHSGMSALADVIARRPGSDGD